MSRLSARHFVPLVATNDVHYHAPVRRELRDVMTCVREKCTIYNAGFRLNGNAEWRLKPPQEMLRLFRDYPDAIKRTREIADACDFTLDELHYEYPSEMTGPHTARRTCVPDVAGRQIRLRRGPSASLRISFNASMGSICGGASSLTPFRPVS
jgi:error-prone DNA polymerase